MKKLISLIKASMTSGMSLFKIKSKNNNSLTLPIVLSLCFMFAIWTNANIIFEKVSPVNLQVLILSLGVFLTSIMTIVEGVYKTSSLLFNCKDDQLLLSLPIKKSTVLFIRIFKFYLFELLFNSLFIIPIIIAYLRWASNIEISFYFTSIIMILTLPIIPIIISMIIGYITSSISSRFKYKNVVQIFISMLIVLVIFYISFSSDKIMNYLISHSSSINDLIIKIYYPAGVFAKLTTNFNIIDLIIYLLLNIVLFIITLFVLSKFYFKINSRLNVVSTNKKINVDNLTIKSRSINMSLIRKELNTFFKTPVFIINAGFGMVLYLIATILLTIRFDSFISVFINMEDFPISKETIMSNTTILILLLITVTAFLTSITNSVISLEGRNINILKSLPLKTKTILMSKVYSGLFLTTPVLLIGDIILFIKFKPSIIDAIMILLISIVLPLISHFIGLIVNLKYPKLDAENSTEVVKQSLSSFLSVLIGVILLILFCGFIIAIINIFNSSLILLITLTLSIIIDIILYIVLINSGVKRFENLSI